MSLKISLSSNQLEGLRGLMEPWKYTNYFQPLGERTAKELRLEMVHSS
jgi:hypothetical protein